MWPDEGEAGELLDRFARDDPGAAEALWERYREPLRRMVGLRLGHDLGRRVDASDVVQEVLIKASLRLREYVRDPSMPFHVWLRQMARDVVVDQHRRHRQAARRSLERERPLQAGGAGNFSDRSSIDLAAVLRDPGPTPAAAAVRHELERRFREALDRLDADDREILMLRHFDGLANGEAARALGLSDAAAGMRYLRALRRIRPLLAEAPSQAGAPGR